MKFAEIMWRLRDNMTITREDYFWLCKLKRSARSAKDRLFFKAAAVLMEFRRMTEPNEEENCEYYNRKRLRAHAEEAKIPVIAFNAIHAGATQEAGLAMEDDSFAGLPKRLEVATGAPVLLMHNAAVEHGLMNGSQGTVVDIVYFDGCHPNHDVVANRMPMAIVVDFPGYTGPPFFSEPSRRTWVPVLPRTMESEKNASVTRTQFPLCLAWALTPWKAQGMTLAKVIVKLSAACAKPGVLLVALTRVRHPDRLLLEDDFPAFSVIRRQLAHPSFAARQQWERRMRAFFSRTIRRHMHDEQWFTASAFWTQPQSDLADEVGEHWRVHRDVTAETAVGEFCNANAQHSHAAVEEVWRRLQLYPHNFELAAVRGELAKLNMDGTVATGEVLQPPVGRLSFLGWTVDVGDVEDYIASNALSESLMEVLLILARDRWPTNAYVFGARLACKRKVSGTLPRRTSRGRGPPTTLPDIACFPYRTLSKHWVLYVLLSGRAAGGSSKLLLCKRSDAPTDALKSTTAYLADFFAVPVEERSVPSVEFVDLAILFVAVEVVTGKAFDTFAEAARRTVADTSRFFKAVLRESDTTRCDDVTQLAASQPEIAVFLQGFLAEELPGTTGPSKLSCHV